MDIQSIMEISSSAAGYEGLLFPDSHFCPSKDFEWKPLTKRNHSEQKFDSLVNFHPYGTQFNNFTSVEEVHDDIRLPQSEDIKYWVLGAILLILVRKFVERHIFRPFGKQLGIKDKNVYSVEKIPCRIPGAVEQLQEAHSLTLSKSNRKRSDDAELDLQALCKETGLTQREIERWMRRRRAIGRTSTLVKFSESGWKFTTYLSSTLIGIISLWDKPWFWDFEKCWVNYPNQDLPGEVWWYYCFGGSLYIGFFLTHFFDVKRKDFWEMLVHHVVTIGLLTMSFMLNITRMGIITLLLHDTADVFLEGSKMANYAKKKDLATGMFLGFMSVWVVTRLWIFPAKVIYGGTWLHGIKRGVFPKNSGYPILYMLLTLFGLHLFWTYFIAKMALAVVTSSGRQEVKKDFRSSSEPSDSSSDQISDQKVAT